MRHHGCQGDKEQDIRPDGLFVVCRSCCFRLGALLLAVVLCVPPAFAQIGAPAASTRSQSLLGSNIASPYDALDANPACDSTRSVTLLFSPSPLGIENSWSAAVSALYATDDQSCFGASLQSNRVQEIYSNTSGSLQYARTIQADSSRKITAGIRIVYCSQDFGAMYLPVNDLAFDVGISFDLLRHLRCGVAVNDLATIYRNQDVATGSRSATAGISWAAIEEIRVNCAVRSRQQESVTVLAGIECLLDRYVTVRAAAETAIGELAAGIDVHGAGFELGASIVKHPLLGSTVAFGITYGL